MFVPLGKSVRLSRIVCCPIVFSEKQQGPVIGTCTRLHCTFTLAVYCSVLYNTEILYFSESGIVKIYLTIYIKSGFVGKNSLLSLNW